MEMSKKINILIAEDDESSFLYLKTLFSKMGYSVLRASNGQECVDIVANDNTIDLLLMDIRMPIIDGLSATKKIREINSKIIIIAQTSFALDDDRKKALDAGCNDYITKPIIKAKLIQTIEKYFKL